MIFYALEGRTEDRANFGEKFRLEGCQIVGIEMGGLGKDALTVIMPLT